MTRIHPIFHVVLKKKKKKKKKKITNSRQYRGDR